MKNKERSTLTYREHMEWVRESTALLPAHRRQHTLSEHRHDPFASDYAPHDPGNKHHANHDKKPGSR